VRHPRSDPGIERGRVALPPESLPLGYAPVLSCLPFGARCQAADRISSWQWQKYCDHRDTGFIQPTHSILSQLGIFNLRSWRQDTWRNASLTLDFDPRFILQNAHTGYLHTPWYQQYHSSQRSRVFNHISKLRIRFRRWWSVLTTSYSLSINTVLRTSAKNFYRHTLMHLWITNRQ
jgi:hypothetical protein